MGAKESFELHTTRSELERRASALVYEAKVRGFHLRIETESLQPFAQGNHIGRVALTPIRKEGT